MITKPSKIDGSLSAFDRLASAASKFVSRAWFFAACLVLVLLWAPSYFIFHSVDTWQLIINTATTIVTFLLVALLQNTQYRSNAALQHKLNAIADALADSMEDVHTKDARELRAAVGLELRESSS
jgi:low affinity Fe/Cu permease